VNEPRMVEVRRKVLKENDLLARLLRERFESARVQVISLVSSPGSGKATLLERLLTDLGREYHVAIVTKLDLADAAGFDMEALTRNIQGVRPGMPILKVSTKAGHGMEVLEQFLVSRRAEVEAARAV
jgi:Ni2+-binding GTPase involved in maturation of urease and hydrogenase